MDAYKQLVMEFSFIQTTIENYHCDSAAGKILPSLALAIDRKDKEAIVYGLNVIKGWYERVLPEIQHDRYAINYAEHCRTYELVRELTEKLNSYAFSEDCNAMPNNYNEQPVIFLSHRSTDSKYGDAIVQFLRNLGVPCEQIIYTSHPLYKIPMDANIYDFLRNNINKNVFMIILWSEDYLESPACLNEMGAGWVVQCDYTNMYVPHFSFGNPKYHECAVDTRKMGAVLNGDLHCKQSMIEFKNKILKLFSLHDTESNTAYFLDELMDKLKALQGEK